MLLVEKALAKLMGGYLMVRNIQDGLLQMCTGVPYYNLCVQDMISKAFSPSICMIGLQCLSEDEMIEDDENVQQRQVLTNNKQAGLMQAYNYALDDIVSWKHTKIYVIHNFQKSKFIGKYYNDNDFKKTFPS